MSDIRKDLHNNIKVVNAFNTQAISSSTTTSGNIIDLQGYGAIEFLCQMGNWTDGTYTPVLTEGNDSGLSDGTVVSDANNIFGTAALVAAALNADNTVARIGYRVGKYRYVRLGFVSASVSTGTAALSAVAVLGNPDNMPTAA